MDRGYEDRTTSIRPRREARPSAAAPAVAIGGLIAFAGAFLDWASTDNGATTNELSGFNVVDGRIVGAIGFALLLVGILMWANRRMGAWFDADLLCVALSTTAAAVVVLYLIDVSDAGASAELGAYVSLAGALIAMIGSLVAALRSAQDRATREHDESGDIGRRAAA